MGARYLYGLFILFIILVFLVFEINYASQAWFFMDDFSFLLHYSDKIGWSDIIHRANDFGRFISRNLYWHVLYQFFGLNSVGYFLFNMGLIIINSLLLFYFLLQLINSRFSALLGAVSYLISFPLLENYSWISNSQHILGHFFIFLFFITALNSRYRTWAVLFYILGIYANALMIFALGPVLIYAWFEKNYSRCWVGLLIIIGLIYLWLSRSLAVGPYEMQVNFEVFWSNLSYYFGSILRGAILPFWVFIIFRAIKRNDKILAFFVFSSISFYLPFAFLKYQHAMNYFALSYLFAILSIFYLFKTYDWLLVFIFLALGLKSYDTAYTLMYHPKGAKARMFVEQVQLLNLSLEKTKTVCFKSFNTNYKNTKGLAIWDIPPYWWSVGFGDAFKLFISPDINWVLYSPKEKCDRVLVWDDQAKGLH